MQLRWILLALLFPVVLLAQEPAPTNVTENAKTATWIVAGKAVPVKISNRGECWRIVHDGNSLVYGPWYGGGETTTKYIIAECPTLAIARQYIADKRLKLTAQQQEELNRLEEVNQLPPAGDLPKAR